jgi:hypothetical protein
VVDLQPKPVLFLADHTILAADGFVPPAGSRPIRQLVSEALADVAGALAAAGFIAIVSPPEPRPEERERARALAGTGFFEAPGAAQDEEAAGHILVELRRDGIIPDPDLTGGDGI